MDRVRTASPIEPAAKKRLRGSVDQDVPMLHRAAHPFDEEDMGEAAGDGADWDDDLDEWEPPREVRTAKDSVIGMVVNHVLEPKYYNMQISATLSNILTDIMPNFNPSSSTDVAGRIGSTIVVRRCQINLFLYRNQQFANGDIARVVLVRDRQAQSTPTWSDLFTGVGDHVCFVQRPDSRRRFQILRDELIDLPRLFVNTSAGDNCHGLRWDVPLNDQYRFSSAFQPDMVKYRLFVADFRADGASGIQGGVTFTYVDP